MKDINETNSTAKNMPTWILLQNQIKAINKLSSAILLTALFIKTFVENEQLSSEAQMEVDKPVHTWAESTLVNPSAVVCECSEENHTSLQQYSEWGKTGKQTSFKAICTNNPLVSLGGQRERAPFSVCLLTAELCSGFPLTHSQFAPSTAASRKCLPQIVALERGW